LREGEERRKHFPILFFFIYEHLKTHYIMKNIFVLPTDKPSSEIWKDIPDFEGYYQVSNLGNIKSYSYIIKRKDIEVF
jgi:hypothetical protein